MQVRNDVGHIRPVDKVRLRAILRPSPSPSLPGGFDFARKAYFERIGAVGFVLGGVTLIEQSAESKVFTHISRLRHTLTKRILAAARLKQDPLRLLSWQGNGVPFRKRSWLTRGAPALRICWPFRVCTSGWSPG